MITVHVWTVEAYQMKWKNGQMVLHMLCNNFQKYMYLWEGFWLSSDSKMEEVPATNNSATHNYNTVYMYLIILQWLSSNV